MPQMSNLWWLPLMMFTSIMLLLMMIIIFNMKTPFLKKNTLNKQKSSKNWLW